MQARWEWWMSVDAVGEHLSADDKRRRASEVCVAGEHWRCRVSALVLPFNNLVHVYVVAGITSTLSLSTASEA